MLELTAGGYRLLLAPTLGGSIAAFEWRGEPLLRASCGPAITDAACFPLVPFSNRIAWGRFAANGQDISIPSNFPGHDHPHPLHGFGWLRPWEVMSASSTDAVIRHEHEEDDWPWSYVAEQRFSLSGDSLLQRLRVTNRSPDPMPAGLGFHPYFPRTEKTRYHGLHRAEWTTGSDGLPLTLCSADRAVDWWNGRPAGTRVLDTVYEHREGDLQITWPERRLRLTLKPCPLLACTAVLVPSDENFFCVEPVTHATDAINRARTVSAMRSLNSGESLEVELAYAVANLS